MTRPAYTRVVRSGTMVTMRTTALTTALLVVVWGSTFAAVKVGLESTPPLMFAALRTDLAALALVLVALSRRTPVRLRAHAATYLCLGLTNVAAFLGLQSVAILGLPSGLAAVLIYLQPVLVGVLAWRFLGEPLGAAKVAGLVLGFGGIVVVSAGALEGRIDALALAYAVLAALVWAVGTVLLKGALARGEPPVDPWWAVASSFAAGAVLLTAIAPLVEPVEVHWSGRFVLALLYAGLGGTGVAWLLWTRLLSTGEASRVSTYIFFVPLFSIVVGAVLLHEPLHASLLVGAALVGGGVYLANRPAREQVPG